MSGCIAAAAIGGTLFQIGVGGTDPYGYLLGVQGTLSPTTFVDHAGNTRTVKAVLYLTATGNLTFRLTGNVPNTAATFIAIIVNGVYLTRASAGYGFFTDSDWTWAISNPLGTSGTKAMSVL